MTHRHLYSHTSTRYTWIRQIWHHEYENPPSVKLKKGLITERIVALTADQMPGHLIA
ncbi:MAG: hypothetical protein ACOCW3_02585 [Spirochaetota bacterium]